MAVTATAREPELQPAADGRAAPSVRDRARDRRLGAWMGALALLSGCAREDAKPVIDVCAGHWLCTTDAQAMDPTDAGAKDASPHSDRSPEVASDTSPGPFTADTGPDTEPAGDGGGDVDPSACNSNEECAPGSCVTGTCRASSGLVLYWPFDDPDGSSAVRDSSGNGRDGTFVAGTSGSIAAFSTEVPSAITFSNPSCRSYDLNQRHAVQLVNMPPAMRLSNNYTLSAWFRVKNMTVDSQGSEIMSAGDQYSMRASPTWVQMSKRTTDGAGGGVHIQVKFTTTTHLDGIWHHLAGVATPEGMKLYMDGVLVATHLTSTNPIAGSDVRYDRGNDFFVARHGDIAQTSYDFNGEIDDVRIYDHPMTDSDVAWLAAGKP